MNHIITTRCSFVDDDLFQKYFEVMKKMYIPSIIAQTEKNFKLHISTDRKKNLHHKEIISKEFVGTDIEIIFDVKDIKKYLAEGAFNIQTRHDCDDWMCPTYIEKIQQTYMDNVDKYDEFMIHTQPVKYDFDTGQEYYIKPYTETCTSMFLSLCQKHPTKHILQEKHADFPKIVPTVLSLGEGYTKLVIHKNNKLSRVLKGEKRL